MRVLPRFLVSAAIAARCGSATPGTVPATHDDFRAVQRHEANIEAHRRDATDPTSGCEVACPAARAVCEAADAICRIADATADLDAIARCRQARNACGEARATPRPRCGCDG